MPSVTAWLTLAGLDVAIGPSVRGGWPILLTEGISPEVSRRDRSGGDGGTRTLTGGVLSALPLPLGYVPGEPGLAQASILAHAVGAEGGVQPCSLLLHRRLEDLDDPPEALGLLS